MLVKMTKIKNVSENNFTKHEMLFILTLTDLKGGVNNDRFKVH